MPGLTPTLEGLGGEGWEGGPESSPLLQTTQALRAPRAIPRKHFPLHFKQIGGLAGHYHLEWPVMGN